MRKRNEFYCTNFLPLVMSAWHSVVRLRGLLSALGKTDQLAMSARGTGEREGVGSGRCRCLVCAEPHVRKTMMVMQDPDLRALLQLEKCAKGVSESLKNQRVGNPKKAPKTSHKV